MSNTCRLNECICALHGFPSGGCVHRADLIQHDHYFEDRKVSNVFTCQCGASVIKGSWHACYIGEGLLNSPNDLRSWPSFNYSEIPSSSEKVADSHLNPRDGHNHHTLQGACNTQAPTALASHTVQACIDALDRPTNACNQALSFEAGRQAMLHMVLAKLQSLLPNPRRKSLEDTLRGFVDPNSLQDAVDAVMVDELDRRNAVLRGHHNGEQA